MRIAILTKDRNRSPKVLAKGLQQMLTDLNIESKIYFQLDMVKRMFPLSDILSSKIKRYKIVQKIRHLITDYKLINELKQYDTLIIVETIPNAFWKNHYYISALKKKTGKPVFLYEVYYLGNAPTIQKKLKDENHDGIEKYDGYLSVSELTEIKTEKHKNWTPIGLNLKHAGLEPVKKEKFTALVDFPQPGYEKYREIQLKVLNELHIETIVLEGNYSISEIRELYKQTSVYFMQSFEAFGVPIAECLAYGAFVFTPSSAWPMSWRLDENPKIHREGKLPDIFKVYKDKSDLRNQLISLRENYDLENTPKKVFKQFILTYPHFYAGNLNNLENILSRMNVL